MSVGAWLDDLLLGDGAGGWADGPRCGLTPPVLIADLGGWEAFEEQIAWGVTTHPDIQLVAEPGPLDPDRYSDRYLQSGVEVRVTRSDAIAQAFAEGATVQLKRAEYHVPAVRALALAIEDRIGALTSAILFATPAGVRAFPRHDDPTATIAIQLEGTKTWSVGLFGGRSGWLVATESALGTGASLALPASWPHQVTAGDEPSLSLSLALHLPTATDGGPLPPGWHREPDTALDTGDFARHRLAARRCRLGR